MGSGAIPQHPESSGEWSCTWAGRECSSHGMCRLAGRGRVGGAQTAEVTDLELSLVGQHQELALDFDLKASKRLC